MTNNTLSDQIIKEIGLKLYEKALNFPNNKISIIDIREDPIKIRCVILDNEREFHLIIDEKKSEIFHDCPSFLIYSIKEEKICIHLIKLLLMIKEPLSIRIMQELNKYTLTSEDFGSKKKSKNYILLSTSCFDVDNKVEGLNYLSKAIINQSECENIIEKYLKNSIENGFFIEFFEFLKSGYENELNDYFIAYNDYIEKGFKKFFNVVSEYSFFNLLRIIESIDQVLEFKDVSFFSSSVEKLRRLINSQNFNDRYFSTYFMKKHGKKLSNSNQEFKNFITQDQIESLKKDATNYFLDEIENFCVLEKLKLMKNQFEVLEIPLESYHESYKRYKEEIKELEKKVYLKKFSYLKLMIEKYDIKQSKGEFKKKRNTYIVKHDEKNLENPVYEYILSRIGFYGAQDQVIKSTDIGLNFFIMKDLFLDNLSTFPDIIYYKKQFWGDSDDLIVDSIKGFSLLSKSINYSYDIDHKYSNINDVIVIEWDLAKKPIQGSIVQQGSFIPDHNNPLFHDLKPFDLCYCKKMPEKIEGNIIKKLNIITKCSFTDAINSISKGMTFIEGFYPLSLVKSVLSKEKNPFEAHEEVINNSNKLFIPHYIQFIDAFREFLFNFIKQEKDYIFEQLKDEPDKKENQILFLLDLKSELEGLDLPFSEIMEGLFTKDMDLNDFKSKFLEEIHAYIENILENAEIGSTIVFNLKKMRYSQFSKYSFKIVSLRKEEFESIKIIKFDDTYNLSEILKTYYGKQFSKILNLGLKPTVNPAVFKKFVDFSKKLKLKVNVV